MKKIISLILITAVILSAFALFPQTAFAATSGKCGDNLTWSYNSSTKTLTISGSGSMYDYSDSYNSTYGTYVTSAPWNSYCNSMKTVVISSGVKSIGSYAFYRCSAVASITIPYGVTSIPRSAFSGCSSLASISIPSSVTSIGGSAFSGCKALTSVAIPYGVTSIGAYAFSDCSSLTSITIPNSVTSIGSRAFSGCKALTSVAIPYGVTSIGAYAFSDCSSLTSISIPSSVTSIGTDAFTGCSGLEAVHITSIKAWCNIKFENTFNTYGANPLYYAHNLYLNGELVTHVEIPYGFTQVKGYTFHGCTSLKSVTIPDSVTLISGYAFSGCSSLTSVTIPDTVTKIGSYAFSDCTSLTSVTISSSVTSIGQDTFYYCRNLKDVYYYGTQKQKNSVSIGTGNGDLLDATWHYHDPHDWDKGVITSEPTCIDTGVKVLTCTMCGEKTTETVPAKGHIYNIVSTTPATCTEKGSNVYACSACGNTYAEEISALGHTGSETRVPPTCTADGMYFVKCTVCGELIDTGVVPATGHNVVNVGAKEATCTEDGNTAGSYCSVCGETLSGYEKIPALGHDIVRTETKPTCTTDGMYIEKCTRCGKSFDAGTIPATGHTEVVDEAVAPTCTNNGLTEGSHCSVCGAVIKAQTTVPAKGHTWGEGTVSVPATCTGKGTKTFICSSCGEKRTEDIPALRHDFAEEFTVDVEPTEEAPGYKSRHCTRCGEKTDVTEIPPIKPAFDIGDANCDGNIDMKDVLMLRKVIAGAETLSTEQMKYADLDGNGDVNMKDVLKLRKIIAGAE